MLLHPAIIALLLVSVLTSLMLLYSSYYAVLIIRCWDLTSGSEQQLALERRTYLVSTILSYVFAFELLSLFLYMFSADNIHTLFVGAMCAAGTLNVNGCGYPALLLKIINFLAAGVWLIINYVDNRAHDYPLIKKKYVFLLIIAPLIVGETVTLANYLLRLRPDVITSCCGSLFSTGANSMQSGLASLPATPMKIAFYSITVFSLVSSSYFYLRGRGAYLVSALVAATFVIAVASMISFISLYFYELPTHHCPFCILQGEYGYVGYPLYVALLGGGVCGIGVGALMPFKRISSLNVIIPSVQRSLALACVLFYAAFAVIATYRIITSNLVLQS
jgi:hypothetical protein